jgi:hypothetical protein
MSEMQSLWPWWRNKIAKQLGIEAVAKQRLWGVAGGQTRVTTPIGAPNLELLGDRIARRAYENGIPPGKGPRHDPEGQTLLARRVGVAAAVWVAEADEEQFQAVHQRQRPLMGCSWTVGSHIHVSCRTQVERHPPAGPPQITRCSCAVLTHMPANVAQQSAAKR